MGQTTVTAAGGVHGFPAVVTSFVGRAEAGREVAGLLEAHRLVTVTGPGGAGKTRLACEVARRVAGRFADGAWLAELGPVADPAQVAAAVAAALGVHEQPGIPMAEAVAAVLARQQLLLVVDNCEHVAGAAAELCAGLLAACDDVRVLATSREPLAVAGEVRYRLGPLALSGPGEEGEGGSEAVTLFADRARSADAHFVLDDRSAPAVARLVARLDGLPLAIELAAARVEALGVAQLADRLDDRFALLAGGDRLAPERQRSLAATVEWSYQLLGQTDRRVFRALSVFPGPFTLEAAEAVAGDDAGPAVLALVDCSLVSPPRAGGDGRSRYVMLETLRAYGAGLLARAGEREQAAAALAGYALGVAEQAAAGLVTGSGEVAAARRLDAEDATMWQVLAWAVDHDADVAVRLAVALVPWCERRGRRAAMEPLLREAAGRAAPGSDPWCIAQLRLGDAAFSQADPAGALGHYTAVIDAVHDRGPSRALADGLAGRSLALSNMGRLGEAASDGHRSLAVARELDDPAAQATALGALSAAALCAGDADGAVRLARQAAQVPGDIGGWVARIRGLFLVVALEAAGDLAAAEQACAAEAARSRDTGDVEFQADLLTRMAMLDLPGGRFPDAAAHLREGLQIAVRAGIPEIVDRALHGCGHLCAATGRPAEAVTVWAAEAAFARQQGFTAVPAAPTRRSPPSCTSACGPCTPTWTGSGTRPAAAAAPT